jgi:GT2 family glycosyltransferase
MPSEAGREYQTPLVGLVTIWYRAGEHIDRFMEDLCALNYSRVEHVFVIHDQTPAEVHRLRELQPRATILDPARNLGSAAGWNLGIRPLMDRGVPYIGMWNVDVRLEPSCLDKLVEAMETDPTIGATQPLLLYSDAPTTVEMFGGSVELGVGRMQHNCKGETALAQLPPCMDVDYLDGGTMLIRATVLRRIGGFDEQLSMYDEDVDLSIRIRKAAYRTVAVRDAIAWHYHRAVQGLLPSKHETFYLARNQFYIARKHCGRATWLKLVARTSRDLPRVTLSYLRRRPILAWAYLCGAVHGIAGAMGNRGWVQ